MLFQYLLLDRQDVVDLDVISIYRSSKNSQDSQLITHLKCMMDYTRICILGGDLNINLKKESGANIVKELKSFGFKQLIDFPTHKAGGIIDHLYVYHPNGLEDVEIAWDIFASFYSDHFGISVVIRKEKDSFKQIQTTVPDYLLVDANSSSSTLENNIANRNNNSKQKRSKSTLEMKKKRR